ncbi:MAG: hypothetical protein ACI9IQ_001767 [Cyclobacteriaceae bacterium]|jgi:hypothetical protein
MRRGKAAEHNSEFEFTAVVIICRNSSRCGCAAKSICRLFFVDLVGSPVLAAPSVNYPPAMSAPTNLRF